MVDPNPPVVATDPAPYFGELIAPHQAELIAFRRDLHRHPELSRREHRTTARIAERLAAAGLEPEVLPMGTGLVCDVGSGPVLTALRADIDALAITEETGLPFASEEPGVCHACGHDVHTTALIGAALALAELDRDGRLPGRIRLVFQPAEEAAPGGALQVVDSGVLEGVPSIFCLHCDPSIDVGTVGTRIGPITSSTDIVQVTLRGTGGHTSRPHLTQDLVFALAQVASTVPSLLSRLIDIRSGVSLVWGSMHAGTTAPNIIPAAGVLRGTLRCLDVSAWKTTSELLPQLVREVAQPYGVTVELEHTRGVPPVVNGEIGTAIIEAAVRTELGEQAVSLTPQSMGGEDFSWYLQYMRGAMCRLGTRTPDGPTYDLHRGDIVIDERAVGFGAQLLAGTGWRAMTRTRDRVEAGGPLALPVRAQFTPGD